MIDRLGSDLDKFFKGLFVFSEEGFSNTVIYTGGDNPWPFQTVMRVALMVLDSLEYVHSKGYAHNDIKVSR